MAEIDTCLLLYPRAINANRFENTVSCDEADDCEVCQKYSQTSRDFVAISDIPMNARQCTILQPLIGKNVECIHTTEKTRPELTVRFNNEKEFIKAIKNYIALRSI